MNVNRERFAYLQPAIIIGALSLAVFSLDLAAVKTGVFQSADRRLELSIHQELGAGLRSPMLFLSLVGGTAGVLLLTTAAALFAVVRRMYSAAFLLIASSVGAILLETALKLLVRRARPHLWPDALVVGSYAFPSGHATESTAGLAMLTYVIWRYVGRRPGIVVGIASAMVCGGIGLSRIYLGAHWPTDVLAGIAIALSWDCVLVATSERWRLVKRGLLPREPRQGVSGG